MLENGAATANGSFVFVQRVKNSSETERNDIVMSIQRATMTSLHPLSLTSPPCFLIRSVSQSSLSSADTNQSQAEEIPGTRATSCRLSLLIHLVLNQTNSQIPSTSGKKSHCCCHGDSSCGHSRTVTSLWPKES